ncbi:MAG: thiol-disulfide isomerase/thioredoxin [Marinoscillum sp.]|jgi:thiol-disulfide isomerase/thioredoxin
MRSYSTILALAVLFLVACEPKQTTQPAVLSGQIINPMGDIVTFRLKDTTYTDTLNQEGMFSRTFDLYEPIDITFGHGQEITSVYLKPNDDLKLSLDPELFDESLKYTGIGSDINNYKAAVVLLEDTIIGARALFVLSEKVFLRTVDSIASLKVSFLEKAGVTDPVFIDQIINNEKWSTAGMKMNYVAYYRYLKDSSAFDVSDDFYAFAESLDITDSANLAYPQFKGYIGSMVDNLANRKTSGDDRAEYLDNYLKVLNEQVSIPSVKSDLIYSSLKYNLSDFKKETREAFHNQWIQLNPTYSKVEEIAKEIDIFERLQPGSPAPDFAFETLEGDTLAMADFLGKVVYLDIWATWCGPCIAEHPYMEVLQGKFSADDVAFVAISTDSSRDPWRVMVADKELGGIHLYAPGAWKSSIIEDYGINGIPRFILIDQKGNIVDVDAARPSGDIDEQIEALLSAS